MEYKRNIWKRLHKFLIINEIIRRLKTKNINGYSLYRSYFEDFFFKFIPVNGFILDFVPIGIDGIDWIVQKIRNLGTVINPQTNNGKNT